MYNSFGIKKICKYIIQKVSYLALRNCNLQIHHYNGTGCPDKRHFDTPYHLPFDTRLKQNKLHFINPLSWPQLFLKFFGVLITLWIRFSRLKSNKYLQVYVSSCETQFVAIMEGNPVRNFEKSMFTYARNSNKPDRKIWR